MKDHAQEVVGVGIVGDPTAQHQFGGLVLESREKGLPGQGGDFHVHSQVLRPRLLQEGEEALVPQAVGMKECHAGEILAAGIARLGQQVTGRCGIVGQANVG